MTLLTGKNNTGKTAALESLLVHAGEHNPNLVLVVNAVRGLNEFRVENIQTSEAPWLSAFTGYDDSQPIKLIGEVLTKAKQYETKIVQISSVKNHTELAGLGAQFRSLPMTSEGTYSQVLKLELTEGKKGKTSKHFLYYDGNQQVVTPPSPMVKTQTRFISPHHRDTAEEHATQFARFQLDGNVDLLVSALQEIEPRLTKLTLVFNGEPMLHGDLGLPDRRLLPIAVMGDGVSRIVNLLLAIGNAKGGIVLVDDIDTGLHHSVMIGFWRSIMKAAQMFDVQVVATTHSDECVRAALASATSNGIRENLSLIRMERQNGNVKAFTFDSEDMDAAFATGLEVR